MNLGLMLEGMANVRRGKTAIVLGDVGLSYAYLDKASNKVANTLLGLGVKKGDRVAMLLSNSPDFVVAFFGIVKSGAIAVPLDPQYKLGELKAIFDDCCPVGLVSENACLEPLTPSLSDFEYIKHIVNIDATEDDKYLSFRKIIDNASVRRIADEPESDDVALILYTSGPSLHPRGVMLSHIGLVKEAELIADGFQQTDTDVVMLYALPMYHVFGLVAVLLSAVSKGSSVVMVPGTGLSINTCMTAIEKESGTMFFGVPYIFALAVDIAEKEGVKNNLQSLRLCSSSADFLPESVRKRFKELYGYTILDCFALTEAVCHVTCPPANGEGKPGSVGKPLSGWEVRIIDVKCHETPAGKHGEIVVKGPFMEGYYNNPAATAEVIKNSWLHTGDIGKVDDEGNLYITGRKKDLIIVKGQNIHPSDVEEVLSQHPDIAEVAVIGIPDDMRGEVVGAVVSLKPGSTLGEQEIKKFCLERSASYKVPKQVIFQDSLPRAKDGNIDKESIRGKLSIPSPFTRVIDS